MEESSKNDTVAGILLIIIIFVGGVMLSNRNERIAELENNLLDTEYELHKTKDDLEVVQTNLDQANSNIEDAKFYTWESYQEMGEALDNLETVE